MRVFFVLSGLALLAACATAPVDPEVQVAQSTKEAQALAKAMKGRVPTGDPQSCINMRDIRSTTTVGRSTVVYDMNSGLAYRQDFSGSCVGLNDRDAMITRTPSTQLCRGDIVRLADLQVGMETGSCVFSDFQPYRKPG